MMSLLTLPLSAPIPGPIKRKRVLLVDVSAAKRELRAEAMRKLGVDVDCACDIAEARSWWRPDLYDLVLMNMENELGHRDKFCEDVRGATPPQQLAFLVGKPEYLANSPNSDAAPSPQRRDHSENQTEASAAQAADGFGGSPLYWGIMEASRRISAVRSVFAARSTAIRNRPTPPRDREARDLKRGDTFSEIVSELQGEKML
jgi:hypothetical protein